MPYRTTPLPDDGIELTLWPHQSLTADGLVLFIGTTALLLALPVLANLGSVAAWVILASVGAALWGVWFAIARNRRTRAAVREILVIARDHVRLIRHDPDRHPRQWDANPHWVRLTLHPTGGPVPHYLTLNGNGREVELGAFLTEDERRALLPELQARLSALRRTGTVGFSHPTPDP
jgi:uncharacterized membrane protein